MKRAKGFSLVLKLYLFVILAIFISYITSCQNNKYSWEDYYVAIETGNNTNAKRPINNQSHNVIDINLSSAIEMIDKLNYNDSEKLLLSILNDTQLSNQLHKDAVIHLLYIYNIEDRRHPWQESQFRTLIDLNWSSLSKVDLYYYLHLLHYEAIYLRKLTHYNQSLVNVDYALHLLKVNNLNDQFPRLRAKLLGIKSSIFMRESFNYKLPANELLKESCSIAKSTGSKKLYYKCITNLSNSYMDIGDTLSSKNIMKKIEDEVNELPLFNQYYYNINQGVYYLMEGNSIDANQEFRLTLKKFQKANCSRYKHMIYLFMSDAFLLGEQIDSSKHYLNKALNVVNCNVENRNKIKYYAEKTKTSIFQYNFTKSNDFRWIDSSLLSIIRERQLSQKIFNDKQSLHLDQHYTENLIRFLNIIHEHPQIYNNYKQLIINLFEDTKKRRVILDQNSVKNYNAILESYLQKINDHKKNDNYSDSIYKELYDYSKTINKNKSEIKNTFTKKVNSANLARRLSEDNSLIINCIDYEGQSWCYTLSSDSFDIIKINNSDKRIDPLFETSKNYDEIIFLGDGSTESKSVELSLPNANIEYAYSMNQYLSNKDIFLSSSDINILSYTNDATQKSLSSKQYTELYNGYKECEYIQSIFPQSNFYNGAEMNKESFYASMSTDILHISSHAYSDSLKRLESYLMLRDSLNNPVRLYADEILSMPSVPKFVNLSACQTGTGVHMAGAGIYSIARSFLQKGSDAVLKTLWDVDDKATKEFMILFYTKWNEGLSCGEALRRTKQAFKSSGNYSDPKYWAGFILEGNPNLYISKN